MTEEKKFGFRIRWEGNEAFCKERSLFPRFGDLKEYMDEEGFFLFDHTKMHFKRMPKSRALVQGAPYLVKGLLLHEGLDYVHSFMAYPVFVEETKNPGLLIAKDIGSPLHVDDKVDVLILSPTCFFVRFVKKL